MNSEIFVPQASTLKAGTPGQSLMPRAPSQTLQAKTWPQASRYKKTNKWSDGWTDVRMDKLSIVFYRTLSLLGRCPAYNRKLWKKEKKSRARVLPTLVDWIAIDFDCK